jgi:MFS family permease
MPLERNLAILFTTRIVRLFAYGFLSVVLVLYLAELGLSGAKIGILLTLTLVGDAAISLWLTTTADRIGRKKVLIFGALLMVMAGLVFIMTRNFSFLIIAAIIGVISPSGNEIGPFLSIEQASLTQIIPDKRRTSIFAWYNLAGSFATALGALSGGWLAQLLQKGGMPPLATYQIVLSGYTSIGFVLILLFLGLSRRIEAKPDEAVCYSQPLFCGLHKSRGIVLKLSALFALDAFAGGFVIQSLIAYWFHLRFGLNVGTLGSIFFGANLLAGISALLAAKIAAKFGLINTMVFTHIPSNILLCLVPLMPNAELAILLLLLRFSISQMDVPTRQSYTMAVVEPDERCATSGVTNIARSIGAALSPVLASSMIMTGSWLMNLPLILAGGLKIIYDLLLYRSFQAHKPPEEQKPTG